MGGLIATIALGALVGWVASILTGRNAQQGWLGNILVGIVGSLLANWIFNGGNLVLDFKSLVVATIGAVLVCLILNYFQRNQQRNRL